MKGETRKAAIAAYKERKVVGGVYAIRCAGTGEAWVGQWPDLATIQTRQWFMLRQGGHPNKGLQEAWQRHGEAGFSFEVLERLEDEEPSPFQAAELKELAAAWRVKTGARAV